MSADRDWVILDTSALAAFLANEAEAQEIAGYRHRFAIPFMALTELLYLLWTRIGEDQAIFHYALVKKWNRPILWPDEMILIAAGRFKAQYGLGIADSFIAAFSKVYDAPLLTKDKDFKRLKEEIGLISL